MWAVRVIKIKIKVVSKGPGSRTSTTMINSLLLVSRTGIHGENTIRVKTMTRTARAARMQGWLSNWCLVLLGFSFLSTCMDLLQNVSHIASCLRLPAGGERNNGMESRSVMGQYPKELFGSCTRRRLESYVQDSPFTLKLDGN